MEAEARPVFISTMLICARLYKVEPPRLEAANMSLQFQGLMGYL